MSLSNPSESVLVALDVPSAQRAVELSRQLEDHVGGFKVGLELFCSNGPQIVDTTPMRHDAGSFQGDAPAAFGTVDGGVGAR